MPHDRCMYSLKNYNLQTINFFSYHISNRICYSFCIIATFAVQVFQRSMFNYTVGDTQYFQVVLIAMLSDVFSHSASKTTYNGAVFNSDNFGITLERLMQKLFVQWFGKAHIKMCRRDAFIAKITDSSCCKIAWMTNG